MSGSRAHLARSLAVLAILAAASPALAQESRPPAAQAVELPIVQALRVEGAERYTEAQIAAVLGQRIGEKYDGAALERGLERLWTSFHVRAEAFAVDVAGGIEVVVRVHEMAVDREVRFIGNESVDEEQLREWAQLEERSELYLHQAGRVRQRILENYRREGYPFAEVNVVTREGESVVPDVVFEIREGRRVRVKGVEVHGNRSMPDSTFLFFWDSGLSSLAQVQTEGPTLFNWVGSKYDAEVLEADVLAMREVYRDRGWLDAVVEIDRLEFNDDFSEVVVHLFVDEGERYEVSSLSIVGVEWTGGASRSAQELRPAELVIPESELLALCKLRPGSFYERTLRERDTATLRSRYGSKGRIAHPSLPRELGWSFETPELAFDVERHTVAVTYRIAQGRELRLREILINGTAHTRDRVVRRELSVFPGQVADLVEIERSLARINASGYFTDPGNREFGHDPTFRFVPVAEDPSSVDLEYVVEEGRVIDFMMSGGVNSDYGLFASFSLQMRNFDLVDTPDDWLSAGSEIGDKDAFHGAGQTLTLNASPGARLSNYQISFTEPDLFQSHLEPIGLNLEFAKLERIFRTHDDDRTRYKARLGRLFGFDVRAWLGFIVQEIEVSDLDDDGVPLALDFQADQGRTRMSGVTFDLGKRFLDHPWVPHDGYVLNWSNGFYSTDLGGDYDITTTEAGADYYLPVIEHSDGTRSVLHFEANFGAQQPYGETGSTPYTERYFLGGMRTLRGFQQRGVGPMDPFSREPLGGETQLYGTIEFFYPLNSYTQPGSYRSIETLRLGVFFDYGVLGVDSWSLDTADMRTSAGFTIGLVYPMPFVFNFGYPIREFDGDDRQTFSFTIQSR